MYVCIYKYCIQQGSEEIAIPTEDIYHESDEKKRLQLSPLKRLGIFKKRPHVQHKPLQAKKTVASAATGSDSSKGRKEKGRGSGRRGRSRREGQH